MQTPMEVPDLNYGPRPFRVIDQFIQRTSNSWFLIFVTEGVILQQIDAYDDEAHVLHTDVGYAATCDPFHNEELVLRRLQYATMDENPVGKRQLWRIDAYAMFYFDNNNEPILIKVQPKWRNRYVGDIETGLQYENDLTLRQVAAS